MPYKLSPSSLHLFKECPRCFWLHHNKKIRRPSTIFPSLPSGMDKVLKAFFDKHRRSKTLPKPIKHLKVELFQDEELMKVWRNNRKGLQFEDHKGNILRGAVDEILQKGTKLVILDYKTRGYPLKENTAAFYQNQLNIYNFLLRKNNYKTENYAYLLFYHPNKVHENGDVDFHADLVKLKTSASDAEKFFKEAIKTLEGSEPKSDKDCGFCKWRNELK